jgi:hypothetical protein
LKLKLALIALLLIAALLVSGCCCCVIPSHRGYGHYRVPCLMRGAGHPMAKITATAVPAISATPVPVK